MVMTHVLEVDESWIESWCRGHAADHRIGRARVDEAVEWPGPGRASLSDTPPPAPEPLEPADDDREQACSWLVRYPFHRRSNPGRRKPLREGPLRQASPGRGSEPPGEGARGP